MNFSEFKFVQVFCLCLFSASSFADTVNSRRIYPIGRILEVRCQVDAGSTAHRIDQNVYGTNLEWFNNGGAIVNENGAFNESLIGLAAEQGISIYRYPGGTLSDYFNWKDSIGSLKDRKIVDHPTDTGKSLLSFGTPEFAQFLAKTKGSGLITVNAGTGTAEQAAEWVSYANSQNNELRLKDGLSAPINIRYWEIGNELYLPGNPGDESKITVNPDVYASRFMEFSRAMRSVDPSIKILALGADRSHVGPWSEYQDWTKTVLRTAADEIDFIAVHNAYFPALFKERQPDVSLVYPALMAAPEAVDKSLHNLESLIAQYEKKRPINIAITEWGALYSLPKVDPYWVDHVKTQGSGVYIARLLQVFLAHPKVKMANYFKFVDNFFMGWVNYEGKPKVPYWVFALFAKNMSGDIVKSEVESDVYDTPQVGGVPETKGIRELTVLSAYDKHAKKLRISLVNRSMAKQYNVNLLLNHFKHNGQVTVRRISAPEVTSHNGRDISPSYPGYRSDYEPYSSVQSDSILIQEERLGIDGKVSMLPFSVAIVEIDGVASDIN